MIHKSNVWMFTVAVLMTVMLSKDVVAEEFFQDNSLSYLVGNNQYKAENGDSLNTITYDHVSGYDWGNVLGFIDLYAEKGPGSSDTDGSKYYGELQANFSLSYATGADLSFGFIEDVQIGVAFENGTDLDNSYLVGLTLPLKVPGFSVFMLSVYKRFVGDTFNIDAKNNEQLTWGFVYPISLLGQKFVVDGYMDWTSGSKTNSDNLHFSPQIKWVAEPLTDLLGIGGKLELGVEYDYWSNKYGITDGSPRFDGGVWDSNQTKAVSLLARYHF